MTPLAHDIALDACEPIRRRRHGNLCAELRLLDGVHFFELSAAMEDARELAVLLHRAPATRSRLAFLPADRTWLEWQENGRRGALLLQAGGTANTADVISVGQSDDQRTIGVAGRGWLGLGRAAAPIGSAMPSAPDASLADHLVYGFLALVNSPRTIGRRSHLPHAGLQRRLAAARGMVGKFPLQAWTEIVLDVGPPRVEAASLGQTHLSGRKALHFVRRHLRLVGDLPIVVSPHWRGDPALGIRRSRYRVEGA